MSISDPPAKLSLMSGGSNLVCRWSVQARVWKQCHTHVNMAMPLPSHTHVADARDGVARIQPLGPFRWPQTRFWVPAAPSLCVGSEEGVVAALSVSASCFYLLPLLTETVVLAGLSLPLPPAGAEMAGAPGIWCQTDPEQAPEAATGPFKGTFDPNPGTQ